MISIGRSFNADDELPSDLSAAGTTEDVQFDGMRMLINEIAHDFSAPLRAVAQLSGMLAEDMDDEERNLLQLIMKNGDKAQTMFAELRKYTAIDRINDADQVFPLRALLDTVLEQKAADIATPSARVEVTGNLAEITGLRKYWQIYFECLIDNALLYRNENDDKPPTIKMVVEDKEWAAADLCRRQWYRGRRVSVGCYCYAIQTVKQRQRLSRDGDGDGDGDGPCLMLPHSSGSRWVDELRSIQPRRPRRMLFRPGSK
ncbi:MAG: hypothetical protein ACI87H_003806, partial [Gammaproteobacteria bacterium]